MMKNPRKEKIQTITLLRLTRPVVEDLNDSPGIRDKKSLHTCAGLAF
ncbi:MAG: hypothetical protein H0V82_12615 [Candidatus Protochlamydia sp.]|nr:hypothetical protein [Candidatus Protochlamydia sp.]